MSESGASSRGSDSELDDPGRDPVGLDPPRNLFGGGTTDTGQGPPKGSGNVGPADQPQPPPAGPPPARRTAPTPPGGGGSRGRRRPPPGEPVQPASHSAYSTPAETTTAGPV